MVGPTNLHGQVLHSMENSSPNRKAKQNCTKWSFWVQALGLIWVVVVVVVLNRVTLVLMCKEIAQLKLYALLTF